MEIMYKRNGIFEEKIVESRKYKGMKNDKNWPHEKDISCTINCPICEGNTKDKKWLIYHGIVFYIFTIPLSSLLL